MIETKKEKKINKIREKMEQGRLKAVEIFKKKLAGIPTKTFC